jgi:hypothetical protein
MGRRAKPGKRKEEAKVVFLSHRRVLLPLGTARVTPLPSGHGSGSPVSRSGLGAAADQVRVLPADPGRDAALDVSDDERVPVPCTDSMTSTRNSNSLFAGRWLRAPATPEIELCGASKS